MKYMLEREVIIRCIKHILNQYIRDNESDELLSTLISHIFNCLLAPKDFLKKLDDGVVKYTPVTLNDLSKENKPEEKKGDAPVEDQKLSKKEKKKQKNKKDETKEESAEEPSKQFTYDIGELLFKSPYDDIVFEAN